MSAMERTGNAPANNFTDVAIVGCGPIGALMANLLAQRGIHCLVIDRSADVYDLPRAVGMDDEVRRALQAVELDGAYRDRVFTLKGMDLLRRNRRRLRRIDIHDEPCTLGHPLMTLFHQPTLEREIRAGFERFPRHIELRLGSEVEAIHDRDDHVELELRDADGESETVKAAYLLGCDGGRSFVRRSFDIGQHDLGLHQPWVVVDVIMKEPLENSGYAEQICDPARPSTFIPSPPPRKRWEFMLVEGDDPEEIVRPEKLNELIRPWAPPESYDIERAVVYTFHALVAKQWRTGRQGRVLLMGDAAHQMPPFLGQGMCAGVRDTVNLAWKLEAVIRGQADRDLLDSYQSEREEHVRKVIELAVQIGKIIQSRSRVASFFSNLVMVVGEKLGFTMKARAIKLVPIGPGFRSARHPPPAQKFCPLPQPEVGTDRRPFDEVRGRGFTLVHRGEFDPGSPDELGPAIDLFAAGTHDGCPVRPLLDDLACDAVLLRPDHQPFGLYRGSEVNAAHVQRDLQAALSPSSAGAAGGAS